METILDAIAADPNVSEAFKDGMKAGEAKHTPGPWRANSSWIEGPKMALRVAAVDWPSRASAPRTKEEAQANALLISVAPELLECLQTARRQLSTLGTPDDGINNFIIAAIDGAIAKATGAQK